MYVGFKKKYLKYKQKYLELKGGTLFSDDTLIDLNTQMIAFLKCTKYQFSSLTSNKENNTIILHIQEAIDDFSEILPDTLSCTEALKQLYEDINLFKTLPNPSVIYLVLSNPNLCANISSFCSTTDLNIIILIDFYFINLFLLCICKLFNEQKDLILNTYIKSFIQICNLINQITKIDIYKLICIRFAILLKHRTEDSWLDCWQLIPNNSIEGKTEIKSLKLNIKNVKEIYNILKKELKKYSDDDREKYVDLYSFLKDVKNESTQLTLTSASHVDVLKYNDLTQYCT
jgi:hypothetical protein